MTERIPFVQIDTSGAPAIDAVADGDALAGTEEGLLIAGKDGSNNAQFVKTGSDGAVAITDNAGSLTVDDGGGSLTVDGAVSVSNFPATQPVSAASLPLPTGASTAAKQPALGTAGTPSADVLTVQGASSMTALKVDGSAVTQPVSGTVGVSNFPATQAVSAASLPLPSGAATSAKQPTLGTAGAAATDVLTVQGIASMTALKTDGSGVTQPVSAAALPLPSGASTAAKQPALGTAGTPSADVITVQGATSMTALKVDGSGVTQPVSAASLPLPSGASTSANQTTGNNSLSSIDTKVTGLALDATLTGGTQKAILRGGAKGSTTAADVTSIAAGTNQQALAVAIVDASGNQITSFGGSGTVSVSNFPATQPVSAASLPLPTGASTSAKQPALGTAGTASTDVLTVQGIASMTALKVDGSGVTQPVSIASAVPVTDNAGSLTVDSTQLPAALVSGRLSVDGSAVTQPVSAASLPLPSGAATAAKQPALGTAGTAATDVITVQGIASMTALKVDGSAATQPVSGSVSVSNFPATQPVSAAALPLPTGASTAAKQPALGTAGTASTDVLTVQGIASMTALKVDGSAVTQPVSASALPLPTGAATAAKQPAFSTGGLASADVLSVQGCSPMIALKVDGSATTQPVSGTVTANIGTAGSLALDATLTGGTQKAIARGAAKGSTIAADVTSTPAGTNHQALDVIVVDTSGNPVASSLAQDATLTGGTQKTIVRGGAKGATTAADVTSTNVGANHQPLDVVMYDSNGNIIEAFGPTFYAAGDTVGSFPDGYVLLGSDNTTVVHPISLDSSGRPIVVGSGQAASANSVSVVFASSYTAPISGTVTANIGSSGSLALDATLTAGTQRTKITDGTSNAAVKAASTPALATDPALVVAQIAPPSATLSNVSTSTTSAQLLAADTTRRAAMIVNDASAILYIKFGATASATSYTVALAASNSGVPSYYEVHKDYTGRIDAVLASGTGTARITTLA